MNLLRATVWMCIFIAVVISSCKNDLNENRFMTSNSMLLEIDPQKNQKITSSTVNNIDMILPETSDEFLFGDIDKIIIRDNKLFVKPYNRGKLLIFTDKGEEYSIIDQVGGGPGEYLQFTDFDVDSVRKQIVIVDGGNRKVLNYSYKGEWLDETPIDLSIKLIKAYYINDEIHYIIDLGYSKILDEHNTPYSINLFTHSWEFITGYFQFDTPRKGMMGDPYMLFSNSIENVGYYKPFTDSIFHFKGNEMVLAYQLKFPSPVMHYSVFESDPFGNHSQGNQIYNILYDESQSHLFLEYMHKGNVYFTIFDKFNEKLETYTYPMVKESCARKVFSNILGLHGSDILIQTSPENINCLKEIMKRGLNESQLLRLNQIGENDNNFILLLQF